MRGMWMPEMLHTARLSLRRLGPHDVAAVHVLFASDGHTIGDGPIRDQAETAEWLARREMRYRTRGLAWYGLWDRDGDFVGSCGVFVGDRCDDEPEIGYEVDVDRRSQGLAREAARAVTEATHEAGHEHLWATIRPSNLASAWIHRSVRVSGESWHADAPVGLENWTYDSSIQPAPRGHPTDASIPQDVRGFR
jgi:RimJ/RimL family protein N-acetyltransferase